jgi:hypothetical protein
VSLQEGVEDKASLLGEIWCRPESTGGVAGESEEEEDIPLVSSFGCAEQAEWLAGKRKTGCRGNLGREKEKKEVKCLA